MSMQVDGPAVEAGAGGAGAVGDALHLFEVLLVVAAQEQGVDERARLLPAVGRAPWGSASAAKQRTWAAISGASSRPCWTPRSYGSPSMCRTIQPACG